MSPMLADAGHMWPLLGARERVYAVAVNTKSVRVINDWRTACAVAKRLRAGRAGTVAPHLAAIKNAAAFIERRSSAPMARRSFRWLSVTKASEGSRLSSAGLL